MGLSLVSDNVVQFARKRAFENTNRMWDKVSGELAFATAVSPSHRRAAITTTFVLRLAGSARESEKPGMSGATPLMEKAMGTKAALRAYIREMPFRPCGRARSERKDT